MPVITASEAHSLNEAGRWNDNWLVEKIRSDTPDEEGLDEFADRFGKGLYGRCFLLTLNPERACDLAQETWFRVLRRRKHLNASRNIPAYLATIATNLWRDWHRSERRAGPLASHRLESLDEPNSDGDEKLEFLECARNFGELSLADKTLLAMDIDEALGKLSPRLREVLLARFIEGESCAEIAQRFGRTEQSVSGWVRQALLEIKLHMEDSGRSLSVSQRS